MIQAILYLISSIIHTCSIGQFLRIFFEKSKSKPLRTFLFYFLYFVASTATFLLLNIPVINMLISLLAIFIITLNYEASTKKRIIATTSVFFFMGVFDLAIGGLFSQNGITLFRSVGFDNFLLLHFTTSLLTYLTALLLQRFKNIRKSHINNSWYNIQIALIPGVSFLMFIVLIFAEGISPTVFTTMIIMAFVINLCYLHFHDLISKAFEERYNAMLEAKGKEYYVSQCQIMQESAENLKSFRHDIKPHLVTLREYAIKGNTDEIEEYIKMLIGDIEKSEVSSDSGNLAFDSIINYKLKNASNAGIHLNLEIFIPVALQFEIIDIVAILGNLLDNALEAVENVEEKWLTLDIQYEKGTLFIKSENPYNGVIKYKDEDKSEIHSSKQGDNHGYGIKNIRKAVEKYNGDLNISIEDNVFSMSILLF
jgi:Signal transduction histidine kinase regulating citrate/malate metabolism